jgi:hypothetical protein
MVSYNLEAYKAWEKGGVVPMARKQVATDEGSIEEEKMD